MAMAQKQALLVTDAAAARIQALLAGRGKPSVGVRVGVRSRGCSGLSYTIEYADEKGKFDEIVEDKGVTILVDPRRSWNPALSSAIRTKRGAAAVVNLFTFSRF
jgi:iron-sulfur cluster assembly accessory protein